VTVTDGLGCLGVREYVLGVNHKCPNNPPDRQLYAGIAGHLGPGAVEHGCIRSGGAVAVQASEALEAWTVFNPTSMGNNNLRVENGPAPGTVVLRFNGNE
jgi:hypothetical protein